MEVSNSMDLLDFDVSELYDNESEEDDSVFADDYCDEEDEYCNDVTMMMTMMIQTLMRIFMMPFRKKLINHLFWMNILILKKILFMIFFTGLQKVMMAFWRMMINYSLQCSSIWTLRRRRLLKLFIMLI